MSSHYPPLGPDDQHGVPYLQQTLYRLEQDHLADQARIKLLEEQNTGAENWYNDQIAVVTQTTAFFSISKTRQEQPQALPPAVGPRNGVPYLSEKIDQLYQARLGDQVRIEQLENQSWEVKTGYDSQMDVLYETTASNSTLETLYGQSQAFLPAFEEQNASPLNSEMSEDQTTSNANPSTAQTSAEAFKDNGQYLSRTLLLKAKANGDSLRSVCPFCFDSDYSRSDEVNNHLNGLHSNKKCPDFDPEKGDETGVHRYFHWDEDTKEPKDGTVKEKLQGERGMLRAMFELANLQNPA